MTSPNLLFHILIYFEANLLIVIIQLLEWISLSLYQRDPIKLLPLEKVKGVIWVAQKTWLSSIKYLGEKTEKYIFIIQKILSKDSAFDTSLYEVSLFMIYQGKWSHDILKCQIAKMKIIAEILIILHWFFTFLYYLDLLKIWNAGFRISTKKLGSFPDEYFSSNYSL